MDEIDAKASIQYVHSGHPKQRKRPLHTLSKLGSISDQLHGYENVRHHSRDGECQPVEHPFHLHDHALSVTNASHPPHFPNVKEDGVQLWKTILCKESSSQDCKTGIQERFHMQRYGFNMNLIVF
ncbi:unnamed protein product [Linum trigynum]|uniref:Uncharacterized protein n=1 Tax=Linum trigynum TaxID=586398 RepID=A0AAV2D0Q0_9ROSI